MIKRLLKNVALAALIVSTSFSLIGCSEVNKIDYTIKYPCNLILNTGLLVTGRFETRLLNEYDFEIGDLIFTQNLDYTGLERIEIPKTTKNTKENADDNLITDELLEKWKNKGDVRYQVYKDILSSSSVYSEIVGRVRRLPLKIKGKNYEIEDETVDYNGTTCKVIKYRNNGALGIAVCKALGAGVNGIDKLPEDKPVYITYYVDENNQIRYIGCEASTAISYLEKLNNGRDRTYTNMILEIYTDVEESENINGGEE